MDDVEIELQALITEREGMIAENMNRQYMNQGMAYTDISFNQLAEKIRKLKTKRVVIDFPYLFCGIKSTEEINGK